MSAQQQRQAPRIAMFGPPDPVTGRRPPGRTEVQVDPDAVYTVLPVGCLLAMPDLIGWWAEPHNHMRGGCQVVVFKPALCPICRARQAGLIR